MGKTNKVKGFGSERKENCDCASDKLRRGLDSGNTPSALRLPLKLICGILIGIGAVLPGVSGGVLCVIFGIYPVVMDFISHPFKDLRGKLKILAPYMVGVAIGFWGVSKMLEALLTEFEAPCTCLFIGLVAGMLPSLFVSVGKGKSKAASYLGLTLSCAITLAALFALRAFSVEIKPSFLWFVFCGCALAFSVIVPGMSFSTLLMPLGLYTPLVQGIGDFDFSALLPVGIGAAVTFVAFSRLISNLFDKHYSVAQNIVIGVVIAATAAIIPFESFGDSTASLIANALCIAIGAAIAVLMSWFNRKYEGKKTSSC